MKLPGIIIAILIFASSACLNESNASSDSGTETGVIYGTFEAPGDNITGLAWGDGYLWAADASSGRIFRMNSLTGDIFDSFAFSIPSSYAATGLAYSSEYDLLFLGLWNGSNNGYVYQYKRDGELIGSVQMCGG